MKRVLQRCGIFELSEKLNQHQITAKEIVAQAFFDICVLNSDLNAFVSFDYDGALKAAERTDIRIASGQRLGPLDGIPVAIKDIMDVKGLPTSYGCSLFRDNIAKEDARVVAALRKAGAILIGKTNTHQIAMGCTGDRSCWGPAHNPYDLNRMTGGSSSGSAVAVASGMVPVAIGSDTGGSIRLPSALCGTVGLKPTYNRADLLGVLPVWPESDHIGPICRSVRDCAIVFDVMKDRDLDHQRVFSPCLPACEEPISSLRIAIPLEKILEAVDAPIFTRMQQACRYLEEGGATVETISWPDFSVYRTAQKLLLHSSCLHYHENSMAAHRECYDEEVTARLHNGVKSTMNLCDAKKNCLEFRQIFRQLLAAYDAIILPSVCATAPKLQERYIQLQGKRTQIYEPFSGFLWQASVSGLPALALPTGFHLGLPIGLQIVANPYREDMLCRIGSWLEKKFAL